jgi:hypothetical protein
MSHYEDGAPDCFDIDQEEPMKTMLAACILAITFVVPSFAQDGAKKGSFSLAPPPAYYPPGYVTPPPY